MNLTFTDILNEFVSVYVGDILVYSDNYQDYLTHLCKVFERIKRLNYTENSRNMSLERIV